MFLWTEVHKDLPDGLALQPAPQVPQRVDNAGHCHTCTGDSCNTPAITSLLTYDSLLRPKPPQLPLVVYLVKPGSHVTKDVPEPDSNDQESERVNAVTDNLMAAAQGKGETKAFLPRVCGDGDIAEGGRYLPVGANFNGVYLAE